MILQLNELLLFGFHGLYEEERKIGNWFTLNINIDASLRATTNISVNDTIDYTIAYEKIKKVFQQREDLLENICLRINKKLLTDFPSINSVTTSLQKECLPLQNFEGSIKIIIQNNRNDLF